MSTGTSTLNGRRLFAYRGARAQHAKYPGREWTMPGLRAIRLYNAMIRLLRQWAEAEHPDIVERFYAMADIELARAEHDKAQEQKMAQSSKDKGKVIKR